MKSGKKRHGLGWRLGFLMLAVATAAALCRPIRAARGCAKPASASDGTMTAEGGDTYIRALKYKWLTPIYDPVLKWVMREESFKRHLVEQARIERGHRVLDLGCGTGTLTIMIKQASPEAQVIGLDGDQRVLDMARAKAVTAGAEVGLDHGMAFELPYADGAFDRVLSSLMLHHLTREQKVRTMREVFRVLRAGGELHVADLGKPQNALMHVIGSVLARFEESTDNIRGLLPQMVRGAGFEGAEETARYATAFGTVALFRARKPVTTQEAAEEVPEVPIDDETQSE